MLVTVVAAVAAAAGTQVVGLGPFWCRLGVGGICSLLPGLLRVGGEGGGRFVGEVRGGGGGGREGEEEVLWLQVAMDDVATVAGVKGARDLPGERGGRKVRMRTITIPNPS